MISNRPGHQPLGSLALGSLRGDPNQSFTRIGTKIGGVPHRTSAVQIAPTKATMIIESIISASSAVKGLAGRRV